MPLGYKSATVSEDVTLQEYEPSFESKLGAAAEEAWKESYASVFWHGGKQLLEGVHAKAAGERFLTADEVNQRIKESGLKVNLTARDGELSSGQVDIILERHRELAQIKDIRNRTPWDWGSPVRGLAMFGAGVLDPFNLGTAIVPWNKLMPAMRTLEAARLSASPLTRLAGRVGTGAVDGGLTTLALEPLYAAVRNAIGDDYDAVDSMANIAFGTAFGGGVLGLGGAGLDAFRKVTGRSGPSARFRGLSVEQIQKVTDFEVRFKDNKLDVEGVRAELNKMTDKERLAAGFDEVKMRALNEPTNPLFHRVTDTNGRVVVDGVAGRIDATVKDGSVVIDSETVIPAFRRSEHGTAMIERMVSHAADNGMTVTTGKVVDKDLADMVRGLEARGMDVRMAEGTVELPDGTLKNDAGPVFEISEGAGYVRPLDTAQAILERLSPETIQSAFGAGVAQMVDGRPLDVETVIMADNEMGATLSEAEIRRRAEQNSSPEAKTLADPDASTVIDRENASSQKWDALADAEQAMSEADARLNDTVASGDAAFKYSRGKKKDSQRQQTEGVQKSLEAEGNKVINAADIDTIVNDERVPEITLKDLIGMRLFPTIADRTAAGALFTGIDSSKINISIPMLGGPLFPLRLSNILANVVWANRGKGIVSAKGAKVKGGATHMMVVLGSENMHQSNTTVNTAFFNVLEAYARDRRITKKNSAALSELVKTAGDADANVAAAMEKFPGTDDADVLTKYVDSLSFNARKRLLDILGSKKAQDLGAPPLQKILDATRQAEFAGSRWGDGVLVVEIDQNAPPAVLGQDGTVPHPDYPYGIRGRVVGRLKTPVNYELLWQDFFADSIKRTEARGKVADKGTIRYDFQRSLPVVDVTSDLVDRIGPLEQTNIDSPKQARMVADFVSGKWKSSDNAKNAGGISPQEFIDELQLSAGSAILPQLDVKALKADIKSGKIRVFQLGDSRAFVALEKDGNNVFLKAMVNNEQGARGMSSALIVKAIEEGVTHVATFAVKSAKFPKGFLPTLFESMGFRMVGETPTPKSRFAGKQLADAVEFWKQSVSDFDINEGLPATATMEFIGGDRADVTRRFIKHGIKGLLGDRISKLVDETAGRLPRAAGEAPGAAAQPGAAGVGGAERVGPGADLTSRTRAAAESIANLRDNELTNLGLTPEDRAFAQQLVKYARGSTDGSQEAFNLVQDLANSFGSDTVALLESGRIKVVRSTKDLPFGPHPEDVYGMTLNDGTVYMVAENISPAEVRGMVLHEVGVHVGMEKMLGSELFNDVLNSLDQAVLRGEDWAWAAKNAVPSDTPKHLIREEQLAYLVQNAPELPLVKRIIAAVRAWAYKTFKVAQDFLVLTEADYRALAVSALRMVARTEPVNPRMIGGELVSAFSRSLDQIETPAFKNWFGDSKVVDADGKPLVVYHGTGGEFSTFTTEPFGAFFTDNPALASMYARGKTENVMPVYVRLTNPMVVDAKGKNWNRLGKEVTINGKPIQETISVEAGDVNTEILAKFAQDNGYDGVVFKNIYDIGPSAKYLTDAAYDASDVYVAFDQTSIKSAIGNKGTFDPANPDIRYSRGATQDPNAVKKELSAADRALARVRSYGDVLRAAADKLDDDAAAVAAMREKMPDITVEEIDELLAGLKQQVKDMRRLARATKEAMEASDTVSVTQTEAMKAADTLSNNLEMAAVIERRNKAHNIDVRLRAMTFLNQFKDKELDAEGFYALIAGSERVREGSRMSIFAEAKSFRSEFYGGLLYDIDKLGVMREFASGEFDMHMYDALWRMGQDKPDFTGIPEIAVNMAKVINKYQEAARNRRNRFGAWIRDMRGYITKQSHDMYKIREVADTEWVDFVEKRLDIDKMMRLGIISKQDPRGSLMDLYQDFAAGSHMKAATLEEDTVAFAGGTNLARKESVSRALYFRDGIAAYEYNQKFGQGRLAESVLVGLDRAATSAALLKNLGTNPEQTLTRLMDEYEASLTGERAQKFRSKRGSILNMLKQVDGSVNIPGSVTAAKIGAFLRSWQSMAKLGGALISSVTDIANYAAELRYQQDKNLLSGVLEGIQMVVKGRRKGEEQAILKSLGIFHESVASSISARFDSPELVSGKMSAAMNTFFKLNGLTWWTEALRDGAALSHAAYMAEFAGKSFDSLDPSLQRMLGMYKIDSAKWNLISMAKTVSADGKMYLTPDALNTVPRSAYEAYIQSIGRNVSDVSVQNLMDDLAQAMRTMYVDRAHYAVLEPGARTRAFMLQGTQPGTAPGELLRYFGQFKSFSVAMTQSILGREVYGRGYDTVGEYIRKGKGDMLGMASMIAMFTVFGYAAAATKDLIKGRTPRDPLDAKTWIAAMAQGGGLGLYGDFLFGEYSRSGRTLMSSLSGPVAGNLDTLAELWTRLRNGDDTASVAFKTLINNTPFLNLFWARPLLDYLVLFNIQESLNPGYLRRMERKVERENAQTFLFRPSEVVR